MIYVDCLLKWPKTVKWKFGEACHLFADSTLELHTFAKQIRLKRIWFQENTIPHYDLTAKKRHQALLLGAKAVERKEAVEIWKLLRVSK